MLFTCYKLPQTKYLNLSKTIATTLEKPLINTHTKRNPSSEALVAQQLDFHWDSCLHVQCTVCKMILEKFV